MAKESRQRRDQRKKPTMSFKERRAKKHEKRLLRQEHQIDQTVPEEGV